MPTPSSSRRLTVVTGPARSGKSEWAEHLAHQSGYPVTYIATAQVDPTDAEWQARIQQHQQRRPAEWQTQSIPFELAAALRNPEPQACLLVDSLGTWVANLLEQDESAWNRMTQDVLESVEQAAGHIIMVAEETGWGLVPAYRSGRLFRDRLGRLTRQVAAIADDLYLVTAGYALNLSQLGTPLTPQIRNNSTQAE